MSSHPALVVSGASGDLARRMLFPSLYFLEVDGFLPDTLAIVGCARSDLKQDGFATLVEQSVRARAESQFSEEAFRRLRQRLLYASVDATKPDSFAALTPLLADASETIFYLSTSPSFYAAICRNLKAHGLASETSRVVVEKPIGHDLASCRQINDCLARTFVSENHIFRIDHYLGKEAVQNLLALRFANAFFEPLWNKVSIEQIQITVAEAVGVEDRWSYYDEYGAIRDMV